MNQQKMKLKMIKVEIKKLILKKNKLKKKQISNQAIILFKKSRLKLLSQKTLKII
jgi:hypothetical protein